MHKEGNLFQRHAELYTLVSELWRVPKGLGSMSVAVSGLRTASKRPKVVFKKKNPLTRSSYFHYITLNKYILNNLFEKDSLFTVFFMGFTPP